MRRDAIGASFVVSKTLPPLRMSDLSNTRHLVVVLIVLIVVEYTVYIHIRVNDFDIYTLTTERREVFGIFGYICLLYFLFVQFSAVVALLRGSLFNNYGDIHLVCTYIHLYG